PWHLRPGSEPRLDGNSPALPTHHIFTAMSSDSLYGETLYEHEIIVVDPGQTPIRIDKYLDDRFGQVSRNRIQNAIRAEAITVNDRSVKPNYKVRPGDHISIVFPVSRIE